jgi:phenylacetate-CoA ligase
MGRFDRFYTHLPVAGQNLSISLYGLYWHWLRFGGNYPALERLYRQRNGYSAQDWKTYQEQEVRALLGLAVEHVPYYRSAWHADQQAAARAGCLAELPLLEKQPIRDDPAAFINRCAPKWPHFTAYTSGSTGTPIATIWTREEIRDSLAVREVRSANWAGVSFKQPRATFSGRMVEPNPHSPGPFHRYNSVERQIYFSAFHLRAETAAQYVQALRQHSVVWMTGYAVSFYLLARFILEQELKVPPLKAIITTSEKLTAEMRQVMEHAYACRIYEEYSTVENALFASECEHGRLHVSPEVGIVEILHPDGSPCAPGEAGEVVATCLMRRCQIFIRYRLGDVAAWDSQPCPCGRAMPVIKEVIGRLEDVVVGPDGRQMVRFHGIFVHQPHVREGQIIQEALDLIRVKVATEGYTPADDQEIVHRVQQRLGAEVHVQVEQVESIPRSKAGKFIAVISNLPKADPQN